jgi:zinc/manganese transport system substrate-binding protein
MPHCHRFKLAIAASAAALLSSACGISKPQAGPGQIVAVGAENEYANVISQVGGRYVKVAAIMSNPNTDPHSFEASASVAATVSEAKLVVQNGVGYDDFMSKIESASPDPSRQVIDVQHLLGLPNSTPNPHLWYSPRTMPAVARAIATDLDKLVPGHAAYFATNLTRFDATLKPWLSALDRFRAAHPGTPVASTEPVGDYMLEAAGTVNRTPFGLQAAIMNGTDPAPQGVTLQNRLFTRHRVKVFVYNQQVTDTLTQGFLKLAAQNHVPVVGVYETMPLGYSYGSWMLAEVRALSRAVTKGTSTTRLG